MKDKDIRSGAYDAGASLNGRSYGYTVGGVGWYRKHFEVPCHPACLARIRFDGVYMNRLTLALTPTLALTLALA